MIGRILRLVFDSVAGQVIVLLVLSIVAMHGVLTAYFVLSNPRSVFSASPAETVGEIAAEAAKGAFKPVRESISSLRKAA